MKIDSDAVSETHFHSIQHLHT